MGSYFFQSIFEKRLALRATFLVQPNAVNQIEITVTVHNHGRAAALLGLDHVSRDKFP
jgi:hypothetical protein